MIPYFASAPPSSLWKPNGVRQSPALRRTGKPVNRYLRFITASLSVFHMYIPNENFSLPKSPDLLLVVQSSPFGKELLQALIKSRERRCRSLCNLHLLKLRALPRMAIRITVSGKNCAVNFFCLFYPTSSFAKCRESFKVEHCADYCIALLFQRKPTA